VVAVSSTRMIVQCEGEHKGAVDASGFECLQQLTQIGGLTGLVAGVLTVQPNRCTGVLVVLDDLQAVSAPVARTVVAGRAGSS
jgi:hypothetical protein